MQCTCSNVMTFSNPDQHSYIVYSGRSDVYRVTESRHKDVAHQLLYERLHIRHTVICLINQLGLLAQADSLQCQRILSHASSPFTTLHPPTQQSHDSVLIPTPFQRLNILTSCSFVLSSILAISQSLPSVLWCCWLGGRKGIRPVKNRVVGYWRGYLSGARCRLAYGPADATATHSLASVKSRLVLPFWYRLIQAIPDKGLLKGVCVCLAIRTYTSDGTR